MRIAITGSEGFVGKHLQAELHKTSQFEVIPMDLVNGNDITDWNSIKHVSGFDVLVHLAAKTFVPSSFENPREFYHTNITGTNNVLELCRKNNAKLIFISSFVYGNVKYFPIDELHPVSEFNPYSQSKIISEELCRGYNKYFNIPVTIIRPFNLYGPGQSDTFLIPSIIKQASQGSIHLRDPNPRRDFLFITDFINILLKELNTREVDFDILNAGYGKSYAVKEIADIVRGYFSSEVIITFSEEKRPFEILDTVCDNRKLLKKHDWKPNITLEEGLREMISTT
jgi:nucleoside-diphosphate-sugar epimerase